MKCLLILSCFLIVLHGQKQTAPRPTLFSAAQENRRRTVERRCILQTGATQADLYELRNNSLPSTRAARCLLACLHRFVGLQDSNGSPTVDGIAGSFLNFLGSADPSLRDQVVQVAFKCGADVFFSDTTDACDRAYELSSCVLKEGVSNTLGLIFGFNSTAP